MLRQIITIKGILLVLVILTTTGAGQETQIPYTSKRGFKAALSLGGANPTGQGGLNAGGGGMLSVGYGFNESFSAWFTGMFAGLSADENDLTQAFVGLELSLKYSPWTYYRLQPYGRVGVGGYAIGEEDTDNAIAGTGFFLGIGSDYSINRHFGIGFEVQFKNITYREQRFGGDGDFVDLDKNIDGDMLAYMLTFTIQ